MRWQWGLGTGCDPLSTPRSSTAPIDLARRLVLRRILVPKLVAGLNVGFTAGSHMCSHALRFSRACRVRHRLEECIHAPGTHDHALCFQCSATEQTTMSAPQVLEHCQGGSLLDIYVATTAWLALAGIVSPAPIELPCACLPVFLPSHVPAHTICDQASPCMTLECDLAFHCKECWPHEHKHRWVEVWHAQIPNLHLSSSLHPTTGANHNQPALALPYRKPPADSYCMWPCVLP